MRAGFQLLGCNGKRKREPEVKRSNRKVRNARMGLLGHSRSSPGAIVMHESSVGGCMHPAARIERHTGIIISKKTGTRVLDVINCLTMILTMTPRTGIIQILKSRQELVQFSSFLITENLAFF